VSFSQDFASYRYSQFADPLPTPARHLTHDALITHADLIRGATGDHEAYWEDLPSKTDSAQFVPELFTGPRGDAHLRGLQKRQVWPR
jgi:hypothetical protein